MESVEGVMKGFRVVDDVLVLPRGVSGSCLTIRFPDVMIA